LVAILLELFDGRDVTLVDDSSDLGIDQLHGRLRHLWPAEGVDGALVEDGHRSDRLGHAPPAHHVPGEAGCLHHVVLGPVETFPYMTSSAARPPSIPMILPRRYSAV
jgi:hypothetical protein